jgi:hypothetical protein
LILSLSIPVVWQHIRVIRRSIEEALESCDNNIRQGAMMTGSELLENALKYGESVSGREDISFMLETTPEQIVIEVCNGVTDLSRIRNLHEQLDRISKSNDKEALYLERLRELLLNPNEYGKLGLYRIAFEGQFTISYQYTEKILKVRAQRGGTHE